MEKKYEFCLTPAYCLYNGAAVLEQDGAVIKFLMENPKDAVLCGRLSRAFENYVSNIRHLNECPEKFRRLIKIDFVAGSRAQLRKCVSKLYMADRNSDRADDKKEISGKQREAAAVLLLDSILNEARLRKATDIHIEKNCVRLRINGRLETLLELKSEKTLELVQRIKLLAGMNVIENRKSQDGNFVYGSVNPVFLRVSSMAIVGEHQVSGESIVLRILDTSRIPVALGELGFNSLQLEKLEMLYDYPNGLVIICGPTGAGKSTTAAALLVEIEKKAGGALKIMSLEDPPEYVIPGVSQIKVDERNSFSDALNHIFRQDPDVIMIGEIRDEQSAAAALRASLTGHLVFATLHAGGAAEAILRLENLGVDKKLLFQVLRGVVSQELDYLNNELRLYADIAVPKKHFSEKAVKTDSGDELEKLMEHYSNYREVLNETVLGMEKKNRRLKTVVPVYKRREDYAELHKGAV